MARENAQKFYTEDEQVQIVNAIREWEKSTTGEIKVHIENRCNGAAIDRAKALFDDLGMEKTRNRNGVLIYMAVYSHQFAIIGDVGIHQCVEQGFWNGVKWVMEDHFREGLFTVGLIEAIKMVGRTLSQEFPADGENGNEISNDISFA